MPPRDLSRQLRNRDSAALNRSSNLAGKPRQFPSQTRLGQSSPGPAARSTSPKQHWWNQLFGQDRRSRRRQLYSSTQRTVPTERSPLRSRSSTATVLQFDQPTRLQTSRRVGPSSTRQDPRDRDRPLSLVENRSGKQPGSGTVTAFRDPARRRSRPRSRGVSAALYATRMLIFSVGVGVLAGTILSAWDPASRAPAGASQQANKASVAASTQAPPQQPSLGAELAPLKPALQALATQNAPQVAPGIFLLDLDGNAYVDVNGSTLFSAASTIKVPVLIAFFQDVDAGKIRLDELLIMQKELIASGSGDMQYQPPGTQFSALETVTKMITISDNTATNMVITRLGGIAALNQRFKSWGLTSTVINNNLPDLEGTNTTSPKDMVLLMARLSQGDFVSMRSRDRLLDIMQNVETDSLLPRGLGDGAAISHKTGDIGSMVGDVGLVDLPNGKRYAIAVLVKRPFNDSRAQDLIRQISRTTYQFFNRPAGVQANALPPVTPAARDAADGPAQSDAPQ